ncbi:MAG: hypothetical protein ACI9FU_002314, partial [Granulosicoccus sp.]
EAHFSTFSELFGFQRPQELRKREWILKIASLGNGKILYSVRDLYVRSLVVDKPRAIGFRVLKRIYPH